MYNHQMLSFTLQLILYTFCLFSVILAIHPHRVHRRSESNEFSPLFLSFIRPGSFLFVRGTVCVVRQIISRVDSSNIEFHSLVSIVTFYMINETVRVGVHDFTFITIRRWHILVMKFVQQIFDMSSHIHIST